MKRRLLVGALVVLAVLIGGFGVVVARSMNQATYDIRFVIAHDPAPAYYMQAMKHFAETVDRETNGAVRIQILTNKEYGTIDLPKIIDNVSSGKIEMSASTISSLGHLEKDMWALEMPYAYDSYEQVARVIDGPVGQKMLAGLSKHNLHGLAYTYSGGFKVVCSNGHALRKPADFVDMSVLCRDPVNQTMFSMLGADARQGSYHDAGQLMDSKQVTAADMTYTRITENNVHPEFVNELDASFFLTALIINENTWNKLPEAYRNILGKAAYQVAVEERARTIQEIQVTRKQLADQGVKIVTLTPQEKMTMAEALRPTYRKLAHMFSPGLLGEIHDSAVATTPIVNN